MHALQWYQSPCCGFSVANSGDFAPNRRYWTCPWRKNFWLVARRFSGDFSLGLKSQKILAIFGLDWRFFGSKEAFKQTYNLKKNICKILASNFIQCVFDCHSLEVPFYTLYNFCSKGGSNICSCLGHVTLYHTAQQWTDEICKIFIPTWKDKCRDFCKMTNI